MNKKNVLPFVLILLFSLSVFAEITLSYLEQPLNYSYKPVFSSEPKSVDVNVVFNFPSDNEIIDQTRLYPKLILTSDVEDLNSVQVSETGQQVIFPLEVKTTFGVNAQNDANSVSVEAFGANTKMCSNQPTGQTCGEWAASCNEISSVGSYQTFWVYQEYHGIVHQTSPNYNYYLEMDATFPDGADVCWGAECVDKIRYDFSGSQDYYEGYSYRCISTGFTLPNAPGRWAFDFFLNDLITSESDTFYKTINVDEPPGCNIIADSAWQSNSSYMCDETITTFHKFVNNGSLTVNYDIFYEVFDPDGYRIQTGSTSGLLDPGFSFTGTANSPAPPSGWNKQGYYKVRAKMTAECGTNDDIEYTYTWAYVPVAPCQQGDIVAVNAYPIKDSFACNEDLQSKHEFENTGSYDFEYTLYNDVFDPDGIWIGSGSQSGNTLSSGSGVIWAITDFIQNFGNWTKSGNYKNKVRLEGQFSNAVPDSAISEALMYVPTACSGDEINGFNGSPVQSSFACNETIVTEEHRFENTSNLYPFGYTFYLELYDPTGNLVGSGFEPSIILPPQTIHSWRMEISVPENGWPESGVYTAKTWVEGAYEDGRTRTAYSFAYPNVPIAPCSTCVATSDSAWVDQDGLCNDPIITKHKFANSGVENIPYSIDFLLYNPLGTLVSQSLNSYTLEVGYNNTWTVTWTVPSNGWGSGSYTAEAHLNGTCAEGDQASASNTVFPVIPSSCDSATCSGVINVTVEDTESNSVSGAKVYLDGSHDSDTNSQGVVTLNTIDAACGESHNVAIYCSDGTYCDTKSTTIHFDGDNDPLNFTCSVCTQTESLLVTVTANSAYALNDTIDLEITVRNGSGGLVDAVALGITDPFQGYTVQRSTINGTHTYYAVASSTGAHTFNITASKAGYTSDSTSKTVSVSQQVGSITVDVDDLEGNRVQGAQVFVDGVFEGDTDSSGRKTVQTQTGNHSVQVYCPNRDFCGEKNVNVVGNHSVYFDCGCVGNFRSIIETQEEYGIQNVLILIDGEEKGTTKEFGALDLSNITFGSHFVEFYLNIADIEGEEPFLHYGSGNVNFGSDFDQISFILVPQTQSLTIDTQDFGPNTQIVSISKADENAHATAIPALAIAVVFVGFAILDYGDYTQCVTNTNDFWGSQGQYAWDNFRCNHPALMKFQDAIECKKKMYAYNQRVIDHCQLESGFLALNFIPVGSVLNKGKWVVKGASGLMHFIPHADDTYRIVKGLTHADDIVKLAKDEITLTFKYIDNGFKLIKGKVFVIADTARKTEIYNLIKNNIDTYIQKPASELIDDIPVSLRTDPGNIRGVLGEKSADKYIDVIKQELEREGASVVKITGEAGEEFGHSATYKFIFNKTGGIDIRYISDNQLKGEIDRLLKINGKYVVVEVKAGLYNKIVSGNNALTASKVLSNKINPINQLTFDKAEFLLLGAKEGTQDIASHQGIKSIIDELNQQGTQAAAENMPVQIQTLFDKAGDIFRIANGGAG